MSQGVAHIFFPLPIRRITTALMIIIYYYVQDVLLEFPPIQENFEKHYYIEAI